MNKTFTSEKNLASVCNNSKEENIYETSFSASKKSINAILNYSKALSVKKSFHLKEIELLLN